MEIRLVQGHCDLFEVSRKGLEAETTEDAVATSSRGKYTKSREPEGKQSETQP